MKKLLMITAIVCLANCSNETTNRPTPPDTTTMPPDPALQGDSQNINTNTGTYPTDTNRQNTDSVSGTPPQSRRTTPRSTRDSVR